MKKGLGVLVLGLLVVLIMVVASCAPSAPAGEKTVTVSLSNDLSGPLSSTHRFQYQAEADYIKMLNEEENQFFEVAESARNAGMVISEALQAVLNVKDAYAKAMDGEHELYVRALLDAEKHGVILTAEANAYIYEVQQMEKAQRAQALVNKIRERSIQLRREELQAFQEWVRAFEGAKGGFSEEEWKGIAKQLAKGTKWEEFIPNLEAGISSGTPSVPLVPMGQHGGIIEKPTLVLAGEAGTEALIPLDKLGGIGGGTTVVNNNFNDMVVTDNEDSLRRLASLIYGMIKEEQRTEFGSAYSG